MWPQDCVKKIVLSISEFHFLWLKQWEMKKMLSISWIKTSIAFLEHKSVKSVIFWDAVVYEVARGLSPNRNDARSCWKAFFGQSLCSTLRSKPYVPCLLWQTSSLRLRKVTFSRSKRSMKKLSNRLFQSGSALLWQWPCFLSPRTALSRPLRAPGQIVGSESRLVNVFHVWLS